MRIGIVVIVALALTLSGSTSVVAGAATAPTPGRQWQTSTPAAAGLNAHKLEQIASTARAGKSRCMVVARGGKLAGQWYFRGTGRTTTQDVYSVTKSITSVLVGIAQRDGDLDIGDSASRWITEWQGTPAAAVTVRDILANDSGREWSPLIDYRQLIGAPDRTAFAIGLSQAQPPGTVWAYNNSAIQTLQRVLERATGTDPVTFARRRLFAPLGMTQTRMSTDHAGNAQTFAGVRSTCQDLARLGTLMLNRGRWGHRQIVSTGWVKAATGRPSTRMNAAYGYLWWLNHKGHVAANPLVATTLADATDPQSPHGRLVPGGPAGTYWALGLGNQLVQIDPGSGTVVVRLGTAEPRPRPPTFGPAQASKVVTEAVEGPVR